MKRSMKICFQLVLFWLLSTTLFSQGSGWNPPDAASYTFSSTMTSVVYFSDSLNTNPNDELAFFVGDEINGLASGVSIGGQVYYFVTIYSQMPVAQMTVKYYKQDVDEFFTSSTPFQFESNQIYGSVDNPYAFYFYENGVSPITLDSISTQYGLENCPLAPMALDSFLTKLDTFPVTWDYIPNSNLSVSIQSGILNITGNPGFSDTTFLSVIATSQAPGNYSDTADILIDIEPLYEAPLWNPLSGQGIVKGDTFDIVDLTDYEVGYGGSQLVFDYLPHIVPNVPPLSMPNWTAGTSYPYNMSVTAKVNFTPKYTFDHPEDLLAAKINGEVVGVASLNTSSGLFFLSVGSNQAVDTIDLVFYSAVHKDTFPFISEIPFVPGEIKGSIQQPYIVDIAPILPIIQPQSMVKYQIVDTSFVGEMAFDWIALDSVYANCLADTAITTLCIVENVNELVMGYADTDGDGLGDPNSPFTSCSSLGTGFVLNSDDCNDNEPLDPDITILVTENSALLSNDGIVCKNETIQLVASGGMDYLWDTGELSSTIQPLIVSDSLFSVTVTFAEGCKGKNEISIYREGLIINAAIDSVYSSLRSVLSCAMDGDTLKFNQPSILTTALHASIVIDKTISIQGLNATERPTILADYSMPTQGIYVSSSNQLTLKNLDFQVLNHSGQPLFMGSGNVVINGLVKVRE